MQRDDTPHTRDSGLSTENLAQPRKADAASNTTPPPPVYPSEGDDRTDAAHDLASRDEATPAADEAAGARTTDADEMPQLLTSQDEEGFRKEWENIQGAFVDDPRQAVQAADNLVAKVMQTLAAMFDEHKKNLEEHWSRGEQVDTEVLRRALRHYRSFFNRLLTT
ncbi:hypothetical protein AV521_40885 [Streptomyces sp. IMTB 2501]|uniref:hypothetical protein n=1 Tax=Streptomyces sp. IMTB 2501 TaxID=1776340 RepID=UPI00096E5BD9|nr:hypothetical protein [Streptomyces sp. IMTB 2501]OLZ62781.1 hypothetical protein AV521_40885 [Streptomyces sp. IMTB 2501]